MKQPIVSYATIIFDCDGVVLDSNLLKTEAFYQATLPYGETAAQAMVDYHVANGGVSRYKKFSHFIENIVSSHARSTPGPSQEELLTSYANYVRDGLLDCAIAPGLEVLRQKTPNARWLIVSGGDQDELRAVFKQRGISKWFDGGIFGSPDTKDDILAREKINGNIQNPALFAGDSKYDYEAATAAGLDFVFISDWTEIKNWREWAKNTGVQVAEGIKSLHMS